MLNLMRLTETVKPGQRFQFWVSVFAFSVFKLLFINSYRSTDFEVHRNWLAITNSLPLSQWYYESTSEWTLDYPPFFAWFEWVLSFPGKWMDPNMVEIKNLEYESKETILFQKLSVILMDLVLAFSITLYDVILIFVNILTKLRYKDTICLGLTKINLLSKLFVLVFMNAALFIVDQIHFQYNGFLFGILLLSISQILKEKYFVGAFLFAVLLNFKHIFLYMSPAFGVYLFAKYCVKRGKFPLVLHNLIPLGCIVAGVFCASFGPFYHHIPQIIKRLFPFKRGLSHAYWAPNIWAVYNTADLALSVLTKNKKSNITSGLVGDHSLSILPQVQPLHTFLLTIIFMLPTLYEVWKAPTGKTFLHAIILTSWTSFMFGYHVHEKAILNVIIPFALVCPAVPEIYFITLVSGTAAIFPLLFTPFENVMKTLLVVGHTLVVLAYVIPMLKCKWFEVLYLLGFVPLIFVELICSIYFPAYPFLPLICISDYCFLGLFYSYINFYYCSMKLIKFD